MLPLTELPFRFVLRWVFLPLHDINHTQRLDPVAHIEEQPVRGAEAHAGFFALHSGVKASIIRQLRDQRKHLRWVPLHQNVGETKPIELLEVRDKRVAESLSQ